MYTLQNVHYGRPVNIKSKETALKETFQHQYFFPDQIMQLSLWCEDIFNTQINLFTVYASYKHTQAMLTKDANTHSECVLTHEPLHCTCCWTSFSADISSSSSSLILCSLSGSSRQDGWNKQSRRRGRKEKGKELRELGKSGKRDINITFTFTKALELHTLPAVFYVKRK